MIKVVCDKCGKVLATDKATASSTKYVVCELRYPIAAEMFGPTIQSFDLCDECKDALVAFIKGEEEQNHD